MNVPVLSLGNRLQFRSEAEAFHAGRFGMWLFLLTLSMLFGATLLAFLFLRIELRDSWPRDLPGLPGIVWLSTAVLILSSATMWLAQCRIERDRRFPAATALATTCLAGIAFLGLQARAWFIWYTQIEHALTQLPATGELVGQGVVRFALTAFIVLSVIHALHVIGGLIPMAIVTGRTFADRYTAQRHAGIAYVAMYWHFLDAVWLILLFTLLLGI